MTRTGAKEAVNIATKSSLWNDARIKSTIDGTLNCRFRIFKALAEDRVEKFLVHEEKVVHHNANRIIKCLGPKEHMVQHGCMIQRRCSCRFYFLHSRRRVHSWKRQVRRLSFSRKSLFNSMHVLYVHRWAKRWAKKVLINLVKSSCFSIFIFLVFQCTLRRFRWKISRHKRARDPVSSWDWSRWDRTF